MIKTASGMTLVLGLLGGGCATDTPPPTETTTATLAESEPDLARLRALEAFDVGPLELALPGEATACYGLPCPGWEERVGVEVARQLPRLAELTRVAEDARAEAYGDAAAPSTAEVDAALASLRELHVVRVGELLVAQPATDPYCYNLPCPEDIEAARVENAERAAFVTRLAARLEHDGL
jgi:hypothetical protein